MRPLRVASAGDLGPQFTNNPHRMVGQDGAYSIPLAPGKALWFFGDTLVGERVPKESLWYPGGEQLGPGDMSGHGSIEKLLTNSALILSQKDGRGGLANFEYITKADSSLKQLVQREAGELPDEIRVWCFHGIASDARLYLYYQTVRMLAEGPMPVNFEIIGSGLSVGDTDTWRFQRLKSGDTTTWWKHDQPQFGCAVLRCDDGFIYVYGVRRNEAGTQQCFLARVPEADISRHENYEYLSSPEPNWSRDVDHSLPIMEGMPNEMSVGWNDYLGCYLAVHSLDLSGRIVGRTANAPWGPWSEPVELCRVQPPQLDYDVPYGWSLIYAGKEHPELSGEGGRILYLTYIEFEEYYPHLVEVTLA